VLFRLLAFTSNAWANATLRYVETEKLEGENQYDAVEHGKQDAEKGVSFLEFPPVLNLQLKRFDFDMNTGDMVKVPHVGGWT